MEKTYRIQFLVWFIATLVQTIIYGLFLVYHVNATIVPVIVSLITVVVFAVAWIYHTEDVPEGGFWFVCYDTSMENFIVGQSIGFSDGSHFTIYKRRTRELVMPPGIVYNYVDFYLMPNSVPNVT